jgi:hypothetical protein
VKFACLDLPALPLQLVWRSEPDLRREAVVIIDDDDGFASEIRFASPHQL